MTTVRRAVRFAFRSLFVPAFFAATILGISAGGHGTATVSPKPAVILAELSAHHELPKGTRLSIGDRAKPTVVAYDDRGRLVITPPRGETFGAIVASGFIQLERIATDNGVDIARATDIAEQPKTP